MEMERMFCMDERKRSVAYRAASNRDESSLQATKEFCRENGSAPIDECGDTILHLLAIHGNAAGFRTLAAVVTAEDLKAKNANGDIPLHEAARFGHRDVANEMLLAADAAVEELVSERNDDGETPLFVAAATGNKRVFDLLVSYGSDWRTRRDDGCTVLHAAVMKHHYRVAISILESYPLLGCRKNVRGMMALNVLATERCSFRSGSLFEFTNILGRASVMLLHIFKALIYLCIPALFVEPTHCERSYDPYDIQNVIPRRKLTNYLLGMNGWLREIDDAKQRHTLALLLARRLVKTEFWSYSKEENYECLNPLIQAAKLGINELVMEILNKYPEAAESLDKDGRNILHIIAEQKNRKLYDEVMKTVVHKDRMLTKVDVNGNTILHAVAAVGDCPYVPSGAIRQMTWDMMWFKRIKHDVCPSIWDARNKEGKTAEEVFEELHMEIRSEAEKTSRELANYGLVVSSILATVSFAAVFTLPGGFDSASGKLVLIKNQHPALRLLIIYLGLALVLCAVGVSSMISIVLSKFTSDDFYFSLPVKRHIGNGAVGFTVVFTASACFQAVILEDLLTPLERRFQFAVPVSILVLAVFIPSEVYLAFEHIWLVIRWSLLYKSQYVPLP